MPHYSTEDNSCNGCKPQIKKKKKKTEETLKLLLCSKSVGTVQRVAINTEYKYFTKYLSSDW